MTTRPRAVAIERDGSAVTLRFRALRRRDVERIIAAPLMLAVLAFWFRGVLLGEPGFEGRPVVAALLAAFFVASSLPPLYRYLAPIQLTASSSGLEFGRFANRPRRLERANLRQLFCESRTIPATDDEAAEERFHLFALMQDQTTVPLAVLADADSALYLERELEHALGIQDKPVNRVA